MKRVLWVVEFFERGKWVAGSAWAYDTRADARAGASICRGYGELVRVVRYIAEA